VPEPKILLFDIETSPLLSHTWGRYEQNVIEVEREWFMLSHAHKWLDEKKTTVYALPDFPGYDKNKTCDKRLVNELWTLFNQADVLIGHNLDHFDVKKAQARFAIHGLKPPSPFKTIDTLKIARKAFAFSSNRLDHLGQQLDVGRKLPNTGKSLWLGCMSGDERSWAMMKRYNAQDVALLERVYLKLRAWSSTHPNLTLFTRGDACPVCQGTKLVQSGFAYVASGKKQRMTCQGCGHRFSAGKIIKDAA
jgi:hypothetical protein